MTLRLRVLLDENLPHTLRHHFREFDTFTATFARLAGLKNGQLLDAAERSGFDVLVTGDKTLQYEQNLAKRRLAVVCLTANSGFYTPTERDLTAAWDNSQPLFERIWP